MSDIKLQVGHHYLYTRIQTGPSNYKSGIIDDIAVLKETKTAFLLKDDIKGKFWFLKEWKIDLIEDITHLLH